METRANYSIVGFFVVSAVIGIFTFAFWLAGGNDSDIYVKYTVYFEESVSGLTTGSTVRYRGVNVGSVDDIRIDDVNQDRIRVTIKAKAETPITQKSQARLKFQGITGISFIELVGDSKGKPILKETNEDFPVIESDTSDLAKLFEVTPALLESINEIATRLNILLSVENIKSISAILQNTDEVTSALGEEKQNIKALISESTRAVKQFRIATENINTATRKFSDMSEAISEIAVDSKDNIINFSDSGLRSIMKFFVESRKTAAALEGMAKQLQDNPSSLLYPDADSSQTGKDKNAQ